MKNLDHYKVLWAFFLLPFFALAQTTVEVRLENQRVEGSDFFFDIYLNTSAGSAPLYLGNADFVLEFNHHFFSSPVLSKVALGSVPEVGANTFISTNYTDPDDIFTKFSVQNPAYSRTSPAAITGRHLVINVSDPAPSDIITLENSIARIDEQVTHCLGRFKVSGIADISGTMGLGWVCSGVQRTKILTYDPVTLSTTEATVICRNELDVSLPVELIDFQLSEQPEMLQLDWSTASELHNAGFELQRSENGIDFTKIAWLEGKGNTTAGHDYRYADRQVLSGKNYYYRLKIIASNETFYYSKILHGKLKRTSTMTFSLAPNPARKETNILFDAETATVLQVILYNSLGQRVWATGHIAAQGFNNIPIELDALAKGVYLVEIVLPNEYRQSLKVVKQ